MNEGSKKEGARKNKPLFLIKKMKKQKMKKQKTTQKSGQAI